MEKWTMKNSVIRDRLVADMQHRYGELESLFSADDMAQGAGLHSKPQRYTITVNGRVVGYAKDVLEAMTWCKVAREQFGLDVGMYG